MKEDNDLKERVALLEKDSKEIWASLKDAEKEVIELRQENFWLKNKLKLIRNILDRKEKS